MSCWSVGRQHVGQRRLVDLHGCVLADGVPVLPQNSLGLPTQLSGSSCPVHHGDGSCRGTHIFAHREEQRVCPLTAVLVVVNH